jgi:thymidylate kinase
MNKLVVIESGDRLGKGSLIKGLCEYFDFKNITLRHCDKPPKGLSSEETLQFQFECFRQEANLIKNIRKMNEKYCYHNNIIIYDRFHLGEFVYSQMFRGGDPKFLKQKLISYEIFWLVEDNQTNDNTYLITLTADPEFFHSKEDGNSFSQKLEDKTKELELFKEAHEFSTIKNKLLIKVDQSTELPTGTDWKTKGPNIFRPKEDILNEVLTFIK